MVYIYLILKSFIPMAPLVGVIANSCCQMNAKTLKRTFLMAMLVTLILIWGVLTLNIEKTFLLLLFTFTTLISLVYIIAHQKNLLGQLGKKRISLVTIWIFLIQSMSLAILKIQKHGLSPIDILNQDLLVNLGSCFVALFFVFIMMYLFFNLKSVSPLKNFVNISLLLALPFWGSEILLLLMRMELFEPTSFFISLVARLQHFDRYLFYVYLGLAFFCLFTILRGLRFQVSHTGESEVVRRITHFNFLKTRNSYVWGMIGICISLLLGLSWDLHFSKPPSLSPAIPIQSKNNKVTVAIRDVGDGKLHRFSYQAENGKIVRFFLINVYKENVKIAAALDACLLCGDSGYIQENQEVICASCSNKIYLPSIGKQGGCNPIPLTHKTENGFIIIDIKDLEEGARYFNQQAKEK